MAVQQVFKRYEKKYKLTHDQEEQLLKAVDGRMIMDQYGEHTICNIYFDDDIFSNLFHSDSFRKVFWL